MESYLLLVDPWQRHGDFETDEDITHKALLEQQAQRRELKVSTLRSARFFCLSMNPTFSEQHDSGIKIRKPYVPPKLTRHGTIQELTKAVGLHGARDGPILPVILRTVI